MRKITRKSYRRNVIMFGVMLFVSIALVSTGFAAWVMSSDAVQTPNGDITVSTVTESSLTLEVSLGDEGSIVFGPLAGDQTGNVKAQLDEETEQLKITVKGKVNRVDILEKITIRLYADETTSKNLIAARDAGYITLPSCMDIKAYDSNTALVLIEIQASELTAVEEETESGKEVTGYSFTKEILFGWGSKFVVDDVAYNPSVYYDLEDKEIRVLTYDEVKAELLDMRAMILGYETTGDPVKDAELGSNLKFTVEVTAKAN